MFSRTQKSAPAMLLAIVVLVFMMLVATVQAASVVDYGATGNDTTDDTTAFQNCINANTDIYVPSGTYYITTKLSLGANDRIHGVYNSPGAATLKLNAAIDGIDVGAVSGVTIQDLTLDRVSANTGKRGIVFSGSSNFLVQRVHILDNRSFGQAAIFADSCTNGVVDDCYIRNYGWNNTTTKQVAGVGIRFSSCTGGSIEDSDVIEYQNLIPSGATGNFYQAAGIEISACDDTDVTSNTVTKAGNGIDAGQATDCYIQHNYVTNCHETGVKLVNGAGGEYVRYNDITSCGLAGIWLTPGSPGPYKNPSHHHTILYNTLDGIGLGIGKDKWETTFRPSGILLDGDNAAWDYVSRYNTVSYNDIYTHDGGERKYGWVEDTSLTYDPCYNTFTGNQTH